MPIYRPAERSGFELEGGWSPVPRSHEKYIDAQENPLTVSELSGTK
jgi:hypothetical protein